MNELFSYNINKLEKKKETESEYFGSLKLIDTEDNLIFYSDFTKKTSKVKKKNVLLRYYYELDLSKKTGDFFIIHKIESNLNKTPKTIKSVKNNFALLEDLCVIGIWEGWKTSKFWGVKHNKSVLVLYDLIRENLLDYHKSDFLLNKDYNTSDRSLFKIIIDYHFITKGIKIHNNIYTHVLNGYPKVTFIKKNEYKFLPAMLDEYGIKSKYLISELSADDGREVNIKTLKFICNLFGENYVDYIKKFNWKELSKSSIPLTNLITEKDNEKKDILNLILENQKNTVFSNKKFLELLFDTLTYVKFLNGKGIKSNLKLKSLTDIEYQKIYFESLKKEFDRGFIFMYDIPSVVKNDIEIPIVTTEGVFTVKILITETDFILEGTDMRNCMNRQFINGIVNIFISMSHNFIKKINIQYDRGKRIQTLGKANSQITDEFKEPLSILDEKMKKYKDLTWKKIKKLKY